MKVLSGREIRPLIGSVIVEGDESFIGPNAIGLKLGNRVHFHSTDEDAVRRQRRIKR